MNSQFKELVDQLLLDNEEYYDDKQVIQEVIRDLDLGEDAYE